MNKLTDGQINEKPRNVLGQWPSFEAQSWACKVVHAVLNETPKCQKIQPDEATMLNNGDYTPEELFGAGGVPTCPGCEHCNVNKMFEAEYRAQARSPVFIVDDALVKGADGEYFHLATRTAFKFFKAGRESWTN